MRSVCRRKAILGLFAVAAGFIAAAMHPVAADETRGEVKTGVTLIPAEGGERAATCSFHECIVVGEKSRWYVWFWCQENGQYLNDTVTVSAEGYPEGRGEDKPTFEPKKIPATKTPSDPPLSERSLVTFDTKYFKDKKSTKPGVYPILFKGKGMNKKCPPYVDTSYLYIQVRPKITVDVADNGRQKDVVWWFANADEGLLNDLGYTFKLELTAHGEDRQYAWKIEQGGEYAEFVGGDTSKTTSQPKIKTEASKKIQQPNDLPKNKGGFTVTVTVNGAESDPIKLRVKRPYEAIPSGTLDQKDKPYDNAGAAGFGYVTLIAYKIYDQFGKQMPKRVPVREHFTLQNGKVEVDSPGTDWNRTPEAGAAPQSVGLMQDEITGATCRFFIGTLCTVPPKPKSEQPDQTDKIKPVIHWTGWVSVGSVNIDGKKDDPAAKPIGVKIMNLTWQKFTDRARHCDVSSPPSAKAICACDDIRKTGAKCTR